MRKKLIILLIVTLIFCGITEKAVAEWGGIGTWGSIVNYLKAVGTHIIPSVDNTYGLGTAAKRFKDAYIDKSFFGDVLTYDSTPSYGLKDTDTNAGYMWHLDSAEPNWANFQLWRGTYSGTSFSVNPDKPLLQFDNSNNFIYQGGTFKANTITSTSGTAPNFSAGLTATTDSIALHSAATIVVASSTSRGKVAADYVCDGTADDVQIQAAIDALGVEGGKIFLLEGVYYISSTISIDKRVQLQGVGSGSRATELYLTNGADVDIITLDPAIGAVDTHYQLIKISDLKINGNKANQTVAHYGIKQNAGSSVDTTFENIWFMNMKGEAIYLQQYWDAMINRCVFESMDTYSIRLVYTDGHCPYDFWVTNCYYPSVIQSGDSRHYGALHIIDNIIDGSTAFDNFVLWGSLINFQGNITGFGTKKAAVNTYDIIKLNAVAGGAGLVDINIEGNIFSMTNSRYVINIGNSDSVNIQRLNIVGNTFYQEDAASATAFIYNSGTGTLSECNISGNILSGNGADTMTGIYVGKSTGVNITGNSFNNFATCIDTSNANCQNTHIADNVFVGSTANITTDGNAVLSTRVANQGDVFAVFGSGNADMTLSTSANAAVSDIFLQRDIGSTTSKTAVVNASTSLGVITAQRYNGSAYENSGEIRFQTDAACGVGDSPGRIIFKTVPDASTTLTTAMTIDSSQNVTLAGDLAVNGGDITSTGDLTLDPAGSDVLVDGGLTVGSATQAGDNNLRVEGTSTLNDTTTITKANASALTLRSSAAGSYIWLEIGRTAEEGAWGIAASGGQFSSDAVAGDSVIRAATGNLLLQTGQAGSAIKINTSNNVILSGTLAVNGDSITSDGDLTLDPAGSDLLIDATGPNYAADAGANDDYAITLTGITIKTGMVIYFKANTVNTGACTLNVNAVGAVPLKSLHDQDPVDSYIEAGSIVHCIYDGTVWQILSPDANP